MEKFGRYLLLERVATGGMAEVYRAASLGTAGFHRQLAIKRILPHLAREASFISMLIDEAKIASTLAHPNILAVTDLGEERGVYFLAMEFVSGCPLNTALSQSVKHRQPVPLGVALHVVGQALEGLAYAHNKMDSMGQGMGIIHRDISPQNIMLGYDGSVRLADFGIARAHQRTTETLTGNIKGKPSYMAPEQIRAEAPLDQRADLYSMGVVLYETLALKRMRVGADDVKVLLLALEGKYTRFDELGLNIPPEVANVVYKALEPDPAKRFQDALSFAAALHDATRRLGIQSGAQQTAAWVRGLMPEAVAAENAAQQKFGSLLQKLAAAPAGQQDRILAEFGLPTSTPAAPAPDGTPVLSADVLPPSEPPAASATTTPQRGLPKVAIAVGGAVLLGLVAWALVPAPAPAVDPAVPAAEATGSLVVETEPTGADITLGGKPALSRSPVVVDRVPVGPLLVEARHPGAGEAREAVVIRAGENIQVRLKLVRPDADVQVTTSPPGATVLLDGAVVGRSPVAVRVPGGAAAATLRAELPGYAAAEQKISAATAPPSIQLALVKEAAGGKGRGGKGKGGTRPAATGGTGTLTLQCKPWARIFIDGKDTGRFTPAANVEVSAGRHAIKFVHEASGMNTTFNVDVPAGQNVKVSRELK